MSKPKIKMTKHQFSACELFLSEFPEHWTFDRIIAAIEDEDGFGKEILVWQPLKSISRYDLSEALYDAAHYLRKQFPLREEHLPIREESDPLTETYGGTD